MKEVEDKVPAPQNWLTPVSKKTAEKAHLEKEMPIHVIDEDTRMSAESGSRSQTPARNLAAPGKTSNKPGSYPASFYSNFNFFFTFSCNLYKIVVKSNDAPFIIAKI